MDSSAQPPTALLARQAIFNGSGQVMGYELLYRANAAATSAEILNPDLACRETILSAVCDIGLENLVGAGVAFVNLSEALLLSDEVSVLHPAKVIIEVLEDVPATQEIRSALISLRAQGYKIALDDLELDGQSFGLVDLADIIKVDVLHKDHQEVAKIVERLREVSSAQLLAEKIETHEGFEYFKTLGFELFQGFYLCKPQIVSRNRLPRHQGSLLQLLAAMEEPNLSLQAMEKLVQKDAALSYKLLRLLNSSMMGLRREVTSIAQATVMIGHRRLKRWVTLMALAGFDDSPEELLTLGLVRARMCELLAEQRGLSDLESHFTVGLFSVLDAMSGMDMKKLVELVPLTDEVSQALVKGSGSLGRIVDGVVAYERGEWSGSCGRGYSDHDLMTSYLDALQWADSTRRSLAA